MNNKTNLLDGIAIFVEVVQCNSFINAANKLGHSASHISKEINKLEERLGVRLLNRTTRSLNLTPEGDSYYQQCQQIIDDAIEIQDSISGSQKAPQGKLKISCPVSFGVSSLRPIISEFLDRYPKITLDLDLNDRKVDLIADNFDLVIRASGQLEDSSLISRKFMSSEGVTIASPSYLAKYGTPTYPTELVHHQTLCYRNLKNPYLWKYTAKDNSEIQVQVTSRVVTNNPEMELALCLAGQGIIRMPLFNLNNELETGEVIELFSDFKPVEIGVYLVYPSRKHMPAKVKCFIEFIIEKLGQ